MPVRDVYTSWVKNRNASGGINGHPVQLTVKDDAATPGTSVSDVQSLISSGVDAIADMSIVDEPWATTVQKAGIPVVGIDVTETPYYQNPDFYPEGQTDNSSTYSAVAVAKSAGATNMGYLYCSESVSCAEGAPLVKAAGKQLGVPVVYSAEVAMSAPNYTAQCVAAQQAHVTSIFIGDSPSILARVANDCAQQGYNPIWIEEGEGQSPQLFSGAISKNLWAEFNDIPFYANTPSGAGHERSRGQVLPGPAHEPPDVERAGFVLLAVGDPARGCGEGRRSHGERHSVRGGDREGAGVPPWGHVAGHGPTAQLRRRAAPSRQLLVHLQDRRRSEDRGQQRAGHLPERVLLVLTGW